jgi:hypothetical protein
MQEGSHTGVNENGEPGEGVDGDEASDERGRSSIAFTYTPLSEAERVAQELQEFGGSASPEGIAEALDQKVRSGAFRQKMSAARLFGLISTRPGRVSLTRLGRDIIDPERQEAARVEAFLTVPLYRELFEKYDGHMLPSVAGLENEIAGLGVSPKQVSTARQVFQRSAEQAGFFRRGRNRLTRPDAGSGGESQRHDPSRSPGGPDAGQQADVLQALWFTLLRDGEKWDAERVKAYVDGVRRVFAALGSE